MTSSTADGTPCYVHGGIVRSATVSGRQRDMQVHVSY